MTRVYGRHMSVRFGVVQAYHACICICIYMNDESHHRHWESHFSPPMAMLSQRWQQLFGACPGIGLPVLEPTNHHSWFPRTQGHDASWLHLHDNATGKATATPPLILCGCYMPYPIYHFILS